MRVFVQKWRSEHDDWRILANFILSKNTSRHFKRSEQKKKITKDSLLVEKELIHTRLKQQVTFFICSAKSTVLSDYLRSIGMYLHGSDKHILSDINKWPSLGERREQTEA